MKRFTIAVMALALFALVLGGCGKAQDSKAPAKAPETTSAPKAADTKAAPADQKAAPADQKAAPADTKAAPADQKDAPAEKKDDSKLKGLFVH
jgi:hypothetical protein